MDDALNTQMSIKCRQSVQEQSIQKETDFVKTIKVKLFIELSIRERCYMLHLKHLKLLQFPMNHIQMLFFLTFLMHVWTITESRDEEFSEEKKHEKDQSMKMNSHLKWYITIVIALSQEMVRF